MVLDGPISRVDFIKNVLDIHELGQAFAPGVHSGPDLKLWWTGSPYIKPYYLNGLLLKCLLLFQWGENWCGQHSKRQGFQGCNHSNTCKED